MRILKNRSISVADEDKWTVRLLRQEYSLIEQQRTYKMITDEEYDDEMRKLLAKVIMLEQKYGIGETSASN